jgi:hypothetical protein
MYFKRKGQAATELAIFGSIILVAFSYLIVYSEKLNREQHYLMRSFRRALGKAHEVNGSCSYAVFAAHRMPNAANPYTLGDQGMFSSGSVALWFEDGDIGEVTVIEKAGLEISSSSSSSADSSDEDISVTNETTQDTSSTIEESPGKPRSSSRRLVARDRFVIENGDFAGEYTLGPGGVYGSGEQGLERSHNW